MLCLPGFPVTAVERIIVIVDNKQGSFLLGLDTDKQMPNDIKLISHFRVSK